MKAIIGILAVLSSTFCHAQDKNSSWTHYDVYGVGIDLPAIFSKGSADRYKAYSFPNSVSKDISLSIECLLADAKFTPASLESYHDDCTHFFNTITYDLQKQDYFVISGLDKKGKVLYIKGIKKDKGYYELDLSYKKTQQTFFDKSLSKIATSFR